MRVRTAPHQALAEALLLLFLKDGVEHRFLEAGLIIAPFRVNERIRATGMDFRELLLHAVLPWVISQRHVARKRPHDRVTAVELIYNGLRYRFTGVLAADAKAAVKDNVVSLSSLFGFHGPGGAATRVPRRQMREQSGTAERYRIAIVYNLVDWMLLAAGLESLKRGHIFGHRNYLRTGQFFCQCITFHMVNMRVIPQNEFGVGELEPELLHRL